ncbi:MAG TPA: ankyrin repeat domain-containing protein [Pyrinomonadaceae bacterium]|nr:ankyrin repeat domain-containing protein [Pyrinomonadaceae bacterium]
MRVVNYRGLLVVVSIITFCAQQAVSAPPQQDQQALQRLLYTSINDGDVNTFARLLENGVVKDKDELLLYVVSQSNSEPVAMVQLLLDKGAHVNQPVSYTTPLTRAASKGYGETVKLLLARGAAVNAQSDEGTALMAAVTGGHTNVVKLLLENHSEVNAKHRLGDSALIMSSRPSIPEMNPKPGHPPPAPASEIMSLLLEHGADANFVGQFGKTALMEANSPAKVKLLVAHGAQLNAKDEEGETALMHAVDRGDVEVVAALLQAGADASVQDATGATALMRALSDEETERAAEPDKLMKRRLEAARLLAHAKLGNINAQNGNGETLLMRAAGFGETEMVKDLIARGADVNRTDVFGNTAAVFAYENDHAAVQELLEKTKPSRLTLNAFLRAAIAKKDRAKVKELLGAGADPNYEYPIGYEHKDIKSTVLILAAKTGDPAIVQTLLAAGADASLKGLLYGSESGLKFGTALEAAEYSKNPEVVRLILKALKVPSP